MNNRFILGTAQFGLAYGINNTNGKPGNEKIFDILYYAYDQGIRELDTADAYGDAQHVIGEFSRRANKTFNINTKFHFDGDEKIPEQLERSLEQLGVSSINVYFYHRYSELQSFPETLQVLQQLKQQNKIKKIGVSVYTNNEFQTSIEEEAVDVIQLPFNLLDNYSKRGRLISEAKQKGKTIQVRSVFLQGLFFKDENNFPPFLLPLLPYLTKLKRTAASRRLSMFDLALGYVLVNTKINQVVVGVDSKEQLLANIGVNLDAFNEALIKEIDGIDVKDESLLYPYNWK